jgi:hypothetical protein
MKKTIYENYRVTVIPEKGVWLQFRKVPREDQIIDCEKVIEQIKRHVDSVEDVYMERDTKEVCSFCGEDWDTYKNGFPACCTDAAQEWERDHPKCKGCPDEYFDPCKSVEECIKPPK